MARFVSDELARVSQLTTIRRLATIKFFYQFLIAGGVRQDNPVDAIHLKLPKLAPKTPFSRGELRRLIAATLTPRDEVLVRVFVATGCRLGEVIGLRVEDIDWQNMQMLVRGKGQRQRYVALDSGTLTRLRAYIGGRRGHVWLGGSGPLTTTGCYWVVHRLGDRAGVIPAYPHRFRTTFANEFLLLSGGDLQGLQLIMGHAKITTTAHYAAYSAMQRGLDQQRRLSLADRVAG